MWEWSNASGCHDPDVLPCVWALLRDAVSADGSLPYGAFPVVLRTGSRGLGRAYSRLSGDVR